MISIYRWILQLFGWNSWVAGQPEQLQPTAAQFQRSFNSLGVTSAAITLGITIFIAVLVFYFWWSNGSSRFCKYRYRLRWWFLWMFASSLVVVSATALVMHIVLNGQTGYNLDSHNAYWAIYICNFIYSTVLYFVLSIIISWATPKYTNASCTPIPSPFKN